MLSSNKYFYYIGQYCTCRGLKLLETQDKGRFSISVVCLHTTFNMYSSELLARVAQYFKNLFKTPFYIHMLPYVRAMNVNIIVSEEDAGIVKYL